jgi:hypothetical protein
MEDPASPRSRSDKEGVRRRYPENKCRSDGFFLTSISICLLVTDGITTRGFEMKSRVLKIASIGMVYLLLPLIRAG